MSWTENTWRIPRTGDIVVHTDTSVGKVKRTEGTFTKRFIYVENEYGDEIYSKEPAESFNVLNVKESSDFLKKILYHKGFSVGKIVNYKGDVNYPLQVVQVDYKILKHQPVICLRDARKFDGDVMKTSDTSKITPFILNVPEVDKMLSSIESGLRWKINLSIEDTKKESWMNTGNILEFQEYDDALYELEVFKARLTIRRIASVINAEWIPKLPSWIVETSYVDGSLKKRASITESFNGSPAYFKTAAHAAFAMSIIDEKIWRLANGFSSDPLIL